MIEEYEMALIVVNEGCLDILTFISLKTKSEENMLPVRTKGTFLYHILSKSPQKNPRLVIILIQVQHSLP